MKRLISITSLFLGVCFAGLWAGKNIGRVVHASGHVAFTAKEVTQHYDSARQLVSTDAMMIAFRSDGSRVVEFSTTEGDASAYRQVTNLRTRREFTIYPAVKAISSAPLSPQSVEVFSRRPDPACTSDPYRGVPMIDQSPEPATILGHRVIKVTSERADSRTKTVLTRWVVPDLDCLALQTTATRLNLDGTLIAENTHQVTLVSLGDPEEALFELTLGLTEQAPSAIAAQIATLQGKTVSTHEGPGLSAMDASYHRRRGSGSK